MKGWKFSIRKSCVEVAKIKSSVHEIVKDKEIHSGFAVACQTAKVMATVHDSA